MIYKEIPIQVEGSDKTSRAQFYILDTLPDEMKIQKRPIILICPGGGYHKVSYREGEPLAMHFLSLGYPCMRTTVFCVTGGILSDTAFGSDRECQTDS